MTELDLVAALLQDYALRHRPIRAVYERWRGATISAETQNQMFDDCWQAIKTACEEGSPDA